MKKDVLLVIIVITVLLFTFFAQTGAVELRLAHQFPVGSKPYDHMERFASKINIESKGKLTIRIYPLNTLLSPPEMYAGIVKGVADIGFGWRYKPEGFAIGFRLPLLMRTGDPSIATRILDDLLREFDEVREEWKDVKVLYLTQSIPIGLFSKKVIHKFEDIKGLRIRTPSGGEADFAKALGASPQFMSPADFVMGLDKGTVDGAIGLISIIPDFKLGGKIKYLVIEPPLGNSQAVYFLMNKDSFNGLPDDLKQLLEKTAEWAKEDAVKFWAEMSKDTFDYCKAQGIELIRFSPEDKVKWEEALLKVRQMIVADLDAKGYPGTKIDKFIGERLKRYSR